jgi:putative glutamine amidotransferase
MKNIPLILLLLLVFNENSKASLKNNNKKPKIIGVVSSYTENKKNSNQTSDPAYVLKERYINNLSKICQDDNVVFIVIPNDINQINKFVDIIDGLVLTGGVDIDAKYFNQKKHPKSGNDSIVRTEFEISILKKILAKKKPILGICRGIQLINVALGGDLIQDIPSYIKTDINHSYVKDGIGYM